MKTPQDLLIVAASEQDANLLYAVGMFVPDPFIYLRLGGKDLVVMSDLEIDRARRQAPHCQVLSLRACQDKARSPKCPNPGFAEVIQLLLRQRALRSVLVPENFPLGLAVRLEQLGIKPVVKPGAFFPAREQKSPTEVAKLRAALAIAEAGMAEAMRLLRASRIGPKGQLLYQGKALTSERLRAAIDSLIAQANGLASHTIVAGGKQGADPHEAGHGPLRANQPLILDIFPRSQKTGYFGDITRTVVRGRASEAVRRLYQTVLTGQKLAFEKMRPGVPTAEVHRCVQDYFVSQGYKTGLHMGHMEGFFHGTGHGLGLEIHESPRTGATSSGCLKAGQVVTVEPGLYYPHLGGVRLEDVALVTQKQPRNLTRFEKVLEL